MARSTATAAAAAAAAAALFNAAAWRWLARTTPADWRNVCLFGFHRA